MHLRRIVFHADRYPTREHYPFRLSVFRETESLVFVTPVTFFVGENGTGKSTLLETIARKCGIHIWEQQAGRRPVHNPYEKRFHAYVSVEWEKGPVPGSFFGSAVFRDFARMLDEWAAEEPAQLTLFGGKSLTTLSHGQSIMSFFKARYRIKGLYLLDEPETALSPRTQVELLNLLTQLAAQGHAQFIIATHSPILMACPGATLYSFDQSPIGAVPYEETDHYRLYQRFMADPRRFVEEKP
jgi:predicted ATPase